MLLFFYIIIILVILIALLILLITISKIELKIHNLHISSNSNKKNNEKILIQISLKILNIKWLKIKLNINRILKLNKKIKEEEKKLNVNTKELSKKIIEKAVKAIKDREIRQNILNTKLELEEFKGKINIATEDYIITSYLVAIISTIISNTIPHILSPKIEKELILKNKLICNKSKKITSNKNKKIEEKLNKKIQYYITPIYKPENSYSLNLNVKISTKLLHLLYIAYKIMKKINKKYCIKKEKNVHINNK